MKKLKFLRGSAYIEVIIEKRTISFITPLLNYAPLQIDLDNLDKQKEKLKKMKLDKKILKELASLQTEEDMQKDIIKDLKKSGWEVKYIGSN